MSEYRDPPVKKKRIHCWLMMPTHDGGMNPIAA